jgi:hypothetical protein
VSISRSLLSDLCVLCHPSAGREYFLPLISKLGPKKERPEGQESHEGKGNNAELSA